MPVDIGEVSHALFFFFYLFFFFLIVISSKYKKLIALEDKSTSAYFKTEPTPDCLGADGNS